MSTEENEYVPECFNGYYDDWHFESDETKIRLLKQECVALRKELESQANKSDVKETHESK